VLDETRAKTTIKVLRGKDSILSETMMLQLDTGQVCDTYDGIERKNHDDFHCRTSPPLCSL